MAYEPNDWNCGDAVTAEKLNAMERGIADMNAEYVPNEWQCGDVVTAEKLNHIEQGIANASGGGECDFSTAQVTLINNSGANTAVLLPACYEAYPEDDIPANTRGFLTILRDQTLIRTVVIYKGGQAILYSGEANDRLQGESMGKTLTVTSGSATLDGSHWANITGDCTITIS